MTAVAPAEQRAPSPAVPSGRATPRRPLLQPVPAPRSARRRSPAVPAVVGVGIILGALLGLAAMHALLISGQLRVDDLRRQASAEAEEIRRLGLEVAQLEAPERVLDAARDRLGMVAPIEVGYLAPLVPGSVPTVDGAPVLRVAPATAPAPPVAAHDEAGTEPVAAANDEQVE